MNYKNVLLLIFILTNSTGCGGGGRDDGSTSEFNISGRWAGPAIVRVQQPESVCSFFGGSYPIDWTFAQTSPTTYDVFDGEFLIATAQVDSERSEATIDFSDVENHPPDADVVCLGAERITISQETETTLTWTYAGYADCGETTRCDYSGEAVLERQ